MNYLLIGVDQLRFDTLGYNGNSVCATPNIDQLAAESFRFSKAYTTAPLCSPARASMFTGNYAFRHGMGTNCDMYHSMARELGDPTALLHKKLKDEGYRCGYIGKWHVGTELGPCDYGFEGQNVPGYGNCRDEEDYQAYLKQHGYSYEIENPIYYNPGDKTLQAGIWNGADESTTEYYLAERTIELLKEYSEEEAPFFLTCQFWGPHGPHFPPTSHAGITDRSLIEPWTNMEDELAMKPAFVKRHRDHFYRKPPSDWEEWKEVIGLYYDFTTFIDLQIGRILEQLETLGLKENTVVMFTTDHGDMKGVHGGLIDKGFLYEDAMHIPLLIRHPSYEGDKDIDRFVYNMDLMPTAVAECGLDISQLDGKSLLPLLSGDDFDRDSAYMEFHGIRFLYSQRTVLSEDGYKFIWSPGDMDELYDLNSDPGELSNLIDDESFSEVRSRMIELLKKNAVKYNDPLQDYAYKIFGDWASPSGQVDTTNQGLDQK